MCSNNLQMDNRSLWCFELNIDWALYTRDNRNLPQGPSMNYPLPKIRMSCRHGIYNTHQERSCFHHSVLRSSKSHHACLQVSSQRTQLIHVVFRNIWHNHHHILIFLYMLQGASKSRSNRLNMDHDHSLGHRTSKPQILRDHNDQVNPNM